MDKKSTYDILRELFENLFSDTSVRLNSELLVEILQAIPVELDRIAEELKISKNELSDFRLECIELIAEMYYRDGLNDKFTSLLIKNESVDFKEHLVFLREMEAGIHYVERKQIIEELGDIESSIEDREIEAAVTLLERKKLLDQFKELDAKMSARTSEASASQSKMYSMESPAAASRIVSNRPMLIRIAAILVLVLIPTSIIIFLIPNSSTPPNEKSLQTAKKEEPDTDSDGEDDLLMGSSPNFLIDTVVPDIQSSRMKLPINNDDSFGFAQQIDSIEIQYQYYGSQNKYLESQIQVYKNEIARLDSIMLKSISGEEGLVGEGLFIKECEDRISKVRVMLDNLTSIYAQNIMKSNTYEYENNKIVIHFQCVKCAPFDPSKDVVEIKKEMEDIFLVINDDIEYLIEEGTHDLETE